MPPLRASVRTKLNWYSVLHIAGAQKMLVSFFTLFTFIVAQLPTLRVPGKGFEPPLLRSLR